METILIFTHKDLRDYTDIIAEIVSKYCAIKNIRGGFSERMIETDEFKIKILSTVLGSRGHRAKYVLYDKTIDSNNHDIINTFRSITNIYKNSTVNTIELLPYILRKDLLYTLTQGYHEDESIYCSSMNIASIINKIRRDNIISHLYVYKSNDDVFDEEVGYIYFDKQLYNIKELSHSIIECINENVDI